MIFSADPVAGWFPWDNGTTGQIAFLQLQKWGSYEIIYYKDYIKNMGGDLDDDFSFFYYDKEPIGKFANNRFFMKKVGDE